MQSSSHLKHSLLRVFYVFAVLAVGVALGIVGFYSAIKQASLVANGINEMANGNDVFGKTLILGVFPELYAILAFAAAFLALPA